MSIKKKTSSLTILFLFLLFLTFSHSVFARENVKSWYIKDFQSTIQILKDDSAIITEDIIADCGTASGKHGIFRILPTRSKTPDGVIYSPVELISITDFNDNAYKYQTTSDSGTITWKIGSPNITVTGENNYRLKYKVQNVIREQKDFDEFYWNLSGNYWDMEIDNFSAEIILPEEITQDNSKIVLYDGAVSNKNNYLSASAWTNKNVIKVSSKQTLAVNQGITLSLAFPNGFISHQEISLEDEKQGNKNNNLLGHTFGINSSKLLIIFNHLLLPIIVFIVALYFHKKRQKKNPYHKMAIVTEYDAPEDISPIMLGFIDKSKLESKLITASIVRMAVLKLLSIEEKEKKVLFLKNKYLEFTKTQNQENYDKLDETEKLIFNILFKSRNTVDSDQLRKLLHLSLNSINEKLSDEAIKKGYSLKRLILLTLVYMVCLAILMFLGSFISLLILSIFFFNIKERGQNGQKIYWQIQGFKRYLTVAEKERHSFYEKENIFTKLLPYSIAIGDVKKWVEKMKDIYGEEYIEQSLYWYVGASSLNAISNITNITNSINSISKSINDSIGSNSGQGGGGFSGGGGGGGGGGGW